ncbi:MAG TPA: glutamate synthase-related protein [Candidatus Acidoferrales bacterium]|nr:glutamate synthase-related protein [Candidatus Acidoferrales bacterium]
MLEPAKNQHLDDSQPTSTVESSTYTRYSIEAKLASPRRKLPRPFTPTVDKIGLAKVIIHEIFTYNFKLREKKYRKVVLSRPCIYGTFGGRFGGFHPIKEKCVGCLRCVQENPGICHVERNPEFYNFADSYWISEGAATVSGSPVGTLMTEAETGKIPIKGMGYKGPFAGPGWDSIWTDMSEIVRPTRDGVYGREFISTLVDLGSKKKFLHFSNDQDSRFTRTCEVPLPMIFDYLPSNLNNQSTFESIAGATVRTASLFIATPTQAAQLPEGRRERLVPLISAKDCKDNADLVRNAPAIETELFDASDLSEIRQVNLEAPIVVRLPLQSNSPDTAVKLARDGVDGIHLLANYHGKGWDETNPQFTKDLIRTVHGRLVKESLRDEVTLIASGGITRAEHVPKAIICGADLVAIDTTVLVALQEQFLGECISPKTGRIASERFDTKWGEQRLVNVLAAWHDQLIEILSAMGIRDVRRLRGDVGRAMFNEDLEKEAFGDIERRT